MESRSPLVTIVCALACALALLSIATRWEPAGAASADAPAPWIRPVSGRVVRPFVAPKARYGAGHRGADLAAPPGTPVRAAGAGRVVFAGPVAGTLHVVVEHADGLKTSLSFLATVVVRGGQTVRAGEIVGTAGGSGPEHAIGAVHVALRVRDEYVDPMQLFGAVDLTEVVHLAPLHHRPAQRGLDSRMVAARDLAHSLHLPQGIPGLEPEPEPSLWDQATGAAGDAFSGAIEVGEFLGRPLQLTWSTIAASTPLGPAIEDVHDIASRFVAYVHSRADCTARPATAPSGGGSGHLLFAVGGINSHTDPRTGVAFSLDTKALGYHAGEVGWFSYRRGAGPYRARDTWTDLVGQAYRLRDQLRAFARAHPGREVDLVAHSQGGVVVDAFLELVFDPVDPTLPPLGTVVTLASPHQGAPLAEVAADVRASRSGRAVLDRIEALAGGAIPPSAGTSTRQLDPRSRLMSRLRTLDLPDQVQLTSVSGVDDVVVPGVSATKRGTASVTTNPAGLGDHAAIVRDRQAMTAARLALEQRRPACVGWADGVRGAVEPVLIRRVELTVGRSAAHLVEPPVLPSPGPFPLVP